MAQSDRIAMDSRVLKRPKRELVVSMKTNKSRAIVVSCLAAGLTACTAQVGDPDPEAASFRSTQADLTSDVEYIAELPLLTTCPTVTDWNASSVFSASPWMANGFSGTLPPSLRRFCRYRFAGPAQSPTQLQTDALLAPANGFVAINPLVQGVAAQADALTEAAADELRELAEWRYHHVDGPAVLGTNAGRHTVHLAVVDTEPFGPVQGPSTHGRAMVQYAEWAACPEGSSGCAVNVLPIVGMPRLVDGTADFAGGGWSGTVSDAAVGTLESIERWREINSGLPVGDDPSRLVINLSLGLDKDLFDDAPASENLLQDTLRYAACFDALVVASAGNDLGHGSDGALWPASLEDVPRPDATECLADFGIVQPNDPTSYKPLVHAVGGLAVYAGLSPKTIDGSVPRLVAPASHVPRPDAINPEVMSGTSVSASTVAGIGALVLSYNPELSAARTMQVIYDEGAALIPSVNSDVGQNVPVHRALACEALREACAINPNQTNTRCTFPVTPLACNYTATAPYLPADISAELDAATVTQTLTPTFGTVDQCDTLDGSSVDTYPLDTTTACEESEARDPFAFLLAPQPNSIACATCGFETNGPKVLISLNEDYAGMDNLGVDVTVEDDQGDRVTFELGVLALDHEVSSVALPEEKLPAGNVKSATLTIYFESGRITEDELIVN